MRPTTSATCASPCSAVSLPRSTSLATWPAVTERASSRPACTSASSMSFSTTGNPAAAIVCAICPPIVPAPTTAALNTNTPPASSLVSRSGLVLVGRRSLTTCARQRTSRRARGFLRMRTFATKGGCAMSSEQRVVNPGGEFLSSRPLRAGQRRSCDALGGGGCLHGEVEMARGRQLPAPVAVLAVALVSLLLLALPVAAQAVVARPSVFTGTAESVSY